MVPNGICLISEKKGKLLYNNQNMLTLFDCPKEQLNEKIENLYQKENYDLKIIE